MRKPATILIALLSMAVGLDAQILNVPEDFATIQAAIDASESGDSILVQEGLYVENLIIDHPLTLMSD